MLSDIVKSRVSDSLRSHIAAFGDTTWKQRNEDLQTKEKLEMTKGAIRKQQNDETKSNDINNMKMEQIFLIKFRLSDCIK
jgi:hypothetical protein